MWRLFSDFTCICGPSSQTRSGAAWPGTLARWFHCKWYRLIAGSQVGIPGDLLVFGLHSHCSSFPGCSRDIWGQISLYQGMWPLTPALSQTSVAEWSKHLSGCFPSDLYSPRPVGSKQEEPWLISMPIGWCSWQLYGGDVNWLLSYFWDAVAVSHLGPLQSHILYYDIQTRVLFYVERLR